ncbi:hypothetical protein MMYC01_207401 [Madurella mycetomatis]|uniref:Uncharacterized protein n=1 Tax=Madurella mycetomatis TaxID=100816 RepID=A0A175W259_9PEZI|nr:hypothetical protein MMYC01_207401 [Madurella mycetomatis]
MLRANLNKSGVRVCGARPLTRQPGATNVRTAMYKKDKADGTTSRLEWTPKTYAMVGGLVMAVAGTYGLMMGKPAGVVRTEGSPGSITEKGSAGAQESVTGRRLDR